MGACGMIDRFRLAIPVASGLAGPRSLAVMVKDIRTDYRETEGSPDRGFRPCAVSGGTSVSRCGGGLAAVG